MNKFEEWMTKAFEAAEKGDLDKAVTMQKIAQAWADYESFESDVTQRAVDTLENRVKGLEHGAKVHGEYTLDFTEQIGEIKNVANAAYRDVTTALAKLKVY
jgi:hypothetical protein